MCELGKEKEQLQLVHQVQEQVTSSVFQDQLKTTQVQNLELLEKVGHANLYIVTTGTNCTPGNNLYALTTLGDHP